MATTLYLRNATTNAGNSGSTYLDMINAAGASAATKVANTTASGTEIALAQFISGRFPAGGVAALAAMTMNFYALESNPNANATIGVRAYRRIPAGTETELLSTGRVNGAAELGNSVSLMSITFTANQNRAFVEDDRLVVKVFASNFGTMGAGQSVTLNFNNGTGTPSGSNIVMVDTIAFKAEPSATYVRVGGVWKPATVFVKNAGVWKAPVGKYVRTGGVWKPM